jgi:beta-lactamase class A
MKHSPARRLLLLATASVPFTSACSSWSSTKDEPKSTGDRLAALETSAGGRLGITAVNTANGAQVTHRASERFAFCSTFKVLAISAILKRSATERDLLQRRIVYTESDLVTYSPVTSKHAGEGMLVSELCAAALQYSDNTAANLLLGVLGGPAAVTTFARSIGDNDFRLDRTETDLNTAIPGDPRDTTSPAAMARSLQRLALGDSLGVQERDMLVAWMRGNTTGAKRIRAGVPVDWTVADKTGTGDYGTTNDVAVVWPPGKQPVVIVIYFTQRTKDAASRDDILAAATRIVVESLG